MVSLLTTSGLIKEMPHIFLQVVVLKGIILVLENKVLD